MADRVYDVLSGLHLLGELWRDERVAEIHIQGTEVTVCGTLGVVPVPGFPSLGTARRAIESFTSSQEEQNAVVSRVGDSIVVLSRCHGPSLDAAALLTSEIITEEQLTQITAALQEMKVVTVTGPAARVVVGALASLIPPGSRTFLAAHARLPSGCAAAADPTEADYVIGVRPGPAAEELAAAGQLGGIIANPGRRIPSALRFTVPGRSAAIGRLTPQR